MNVKELLPIGSVILLREATKRLMIYGVKQTDQEKGVDYDYVGVLYPEGNMGTDTQVLFNHEDIQQVFFKGYEDNERNIFINRLDEFYNKKA